MMGVLCQQTSNSFSISYLSDAVQPDRIYMVSGTCGPDRKWAIYVYSFSFVSCIFSGFWNNWLCRHVMHHTKGDFINLSIYQSYVDISFSRFTSKILVHSIFSAFSHNLVNTYIRKSQSEENNFSPTKTDGIPPRGDIRPLKWIDSSVYFSYPPLPRPYPFPPTQLPPLLLLSTHSINTQKGNYQMIVYTLPSSTISPHPTVPTPSKIWDSSVLQMIKEECFVVVQFASSVLQLFS